MPVLLDAGPYGSDRDEYMLGHYARYFAPLVDRDIRLLEIGVAAGGSLQFWADYFPHGRIAGLDREPVDPGRRSDRIRLYQGLQQDVALLTRIARECAPDGFDIIIDDASHLGAPTHVSFWHLLTQHLKPGGIFAIEDWGTGYWDAWPDGRASLSEPGQSREPPAGGADANDFPSHMAGMVGVLKEIVDEVGTYDLSRLGPGTTPRRQTRIDRLEILAGIAFVTRAAAP